MPITSTNTFTLSTLQSIVIDCMQLEQERQAREELQQVTRWILDQKGKTDVRVTLRKATGRPVGRMLRSMLQSLGCVVVMKVSMSS